MALQAEVVVPREWPRRGNSDAAVIRPPRRLRWVKPFTMGRHDGRDQIVRAIVNDGWEAFEYPMPDLFSVLARSCTGVVLDVGANTGFYGLLAVSSSRRLTVHAFEPLPTVCELLRGNVLRNRRASRVLTFPKAVSDTGGAAELHIPSPAHGSVETSASLNPGSRIEFESAITVPVTTIDLHTKRLVDPIELVKIDVEAFDDRVLAGGRTTISRDRPIIFFEQLHQGHAAPIDALRQEWGYLSVALSREGLRVEDVVAYDAEAWNHVLVPEERGEDVFALAAEVGLRLV